MFNAKTISGTSLFNKVGQFLKVIVVNYFNMFNVVMLNFTSFKVKEEKLGNFGKQIDSFFYFLLLLLFTEKQIL